MCPIVDCVKKHRVCVRSSGLSEVAAYQCGDGGVPIFQWFLTRSNDSVLIDPHLLHRPSLPSVHRRHSDSLFPALYPSRHWHIDSTPRAGTAIVATPDVVSPIHLAALLQAVVVAPRRCHLLRRWRELLGCTFPVGAQGPGSLRDHGIRSGDDVWQHDRTESDEEGGPML